MIFSSSTIAITYFTSLVNRIMYCQNIRRNIERSRPNTVTGNVKVNSALACDTTTPPPKNTHKTKLTGRTEQAVVEIKRYIFTQPARVKPKGQKEEQRD